MGRHIQEVTAEEQALAMLGKSYSGLKVLEMGAIEHKTPEPRMPARDWYLERGASKVVSIDLNASNGAIPHDLDTPIPDELRERFDLVTNYGTGEHVNDQYSFFKNCHDACKSGGIMVHQLLHEGFEPGHGRYYYTQESAFRLARLCAYGLVYLQNYAAAKEGRKGVIIVAFLKRRASQFPSPRKFRSLKILDTGDQRRTGDYNAAGFGKLPAQSDS